MKLMTARISTAATGLDVTEWYQIQTFCVITKHYYSSPLPPSSDFVFEYAYNGKKEHTLIPTINRMFIVNKSRFELLDLYRFIIRIEQFQRLNIEILDLLLARPGPGSQLWKCQTHIQSGSLNQQSVLAADLG